MARRAAVLCAVGLLSIAAAPARGGAHDRTAQVVPVGATVPIRVTTTVGDVTIIAWDRPEVAIQVDRHAPTAAALNDLHITVANAGDVLAVAAVQRHGRRDATRRASVIVQVPAAQRVGAIEMFEGRLTLRGLTGGLRATLDRGAIEATRVAGPLHLETVVGDIDVTHAGGTSVSPIWLRAFNGDITLRLPAEATDFRLLALTLAGRIESTIPLTRRATVGPRFGEATRGRGEPVVSLDTVNGHLRIEAR